MRFGFIFFLSLFILLLILLQGCSIPQGQPSAQCTMEPGFSCEPALLSSPNGTVWLNFSMGATEPSRIVVWEVACTLAPPQPADEKNALNVSGRVILAPGGSHIFSVRCKDGYAPVQAGAGTDFSGYVTIWYNYEEDMDYKIKRQETGNVSGTIGIGG